MTIIFPVSYINSEAFILSSDKPLVAHEVCGICLKSLRSEGPLMIIVRNPISMIIQAPKY